MFQPLAVDYIPIKQDKTQLQYPAGDPLSNVYQVILAV
jgi:hypothetical protein